MGFWDTLAKVATAVAAVAIAAVAVAVVVATAPVALAVVATVGIAAVTALTVAEIAMTDDIGQYLADTVDTFVNGKWAENQTMLGQLGRMTLNILAPPTMIFTSGQNLAHNVTHWENSGWHYLETVLNAMGVFAGINSINITPGTAYIPTGRINLDGSVAAIAVPTIESIAVVQNAVTTSAAVAANVAAAMTGGGGGGGNSDDGDNEPPKGGENPLDDGLGTYGEQGGHHPMAKKAFEGVDGYNPKNQLTISSSKLAEFEVTHGQITGQQNSLYTDFAKTGKPLTIEEMRNIEIKALTNCKVPSEYATNAVDKAITMLKESGVTNPVRIPWN